MASSCAYYLGCPGILVKSTLKNDFVNAVNYVTKGSSGVHMTLSMTFPDLTLPQSVLDGIRLLNEEFPGLFRWMGEVNLVKRVLFDNAHRAVPLAAITKWAPFMVVLRERGMPLAVHADLGNDDAPT